MGEVRQSRTKRTAADQDERSTEDGRSHEPAEAKRLDQFFGGDKVLDTAHVWRTCSRAYCGCSGWPRMQWPH